jgi:methyl-accepting chemotaxis protein
MTAGFLGSHGKQFAQKLIVQRKNTDKVLKKFIAFSQTIHYENYPTSFKQDVNNALNYIKNINNIRQKVSSFKIPTKDALKYYTKNNALFLDIINVTVKLDKVSEVIKDVAAYNAFLLAKERAGIERAVGTNTLALDKYGPGMREKFMSLISKQDSYIKTFKGYSSKVENNYYDKIMQGADIQEIN